MRFHHLLALTAMVLLTGSVLVNLNSEAKRPQIMRGTPRQLPPHVDELVGLNARTNFYRSFEESDNEFLILDSDQAHERTYSERVYSEQASASANLGD